MLQSDHIGRCNIIPQETTDEILIKMMNIINFISGQFNKHRKIEIFIQPSRGLKNLTIEHNN